MCEGMTKKTQKNMKHSGKAKISTSGGQGRSGCSTGKRNLENQNVVGLIIPSFQISMEGNINWHTRLK